MNMVPLHLFSLRRIQVHQSQQISLNGIARKLSSHFTSQTHKTKLAEDHRWGPKGKRREQAPAVL